MLRARIRLRSVQCDNRDLKSSRRSLRSTRNSGQDRFPSVHQRRLSEKSRQPCVQLFQGRAVFFFHGKNSSNQCSTISLVDAERRGRTGQRLKVFGRAAGVVGLLITAGGAAYYVFAPSGTSEKVKRGAVVAPGFLHKGRD